VGTRHILFPRSTGIGRPTPPVECRRLPVPRRRAGNARTIACLSGSAAEPADGVATTGLSGETSWPSPRAPADAPVSGLRMKNPLRSESSFLGFSEVGIPHPRNRLPRKTGLVSYPSHCILSPRRTIPSPEPPACSGIIALPWSSPRWMPSIGRSQPAIGGSPLVPPVATPGDFTAHALSVPGCRIRSHHTGSQ